MAVFWMLHPLVICLLGLVLITCLYCQRRHTISIRIVLGLIASCLITLLVLISRNMHRIVYLRNTARSPGVGTILNALEEQVIFDIAKQEKYLGDGGHAVDLQGDDKVKGIEKLSKLALNEEVSVHLSYNRSVPDIRHSSCKTIFYDYSSLPSASIVIIFYNEPYSVLLRTVHSVLRTSDRRILKEILLVDDCSDNRELHEKLDYYVATRFPIDMLKVIRLKTRSGLIRARLAGARIAQEKVIIFLDAHCECMTGWLEPLLRRIQESRSNVLVPIIDVIDANNFKYSANGYERFQIGGFSWDGHFEWIDVPKRERNRQRKECPIDPNICPTYSPTMAGGLFAISRDFFWEIGSYDEQMDGWGGENLEMSFRIWQCGGTIETIPCSRVGHIFREFHPYEFPGNRDTHAINTLRMAHVWMDQFVDLFYMNRPDTKNIYFGDVTHRLVLRKKLKCNSFDWYLTNVYPEKFIPTKHVLGYGRFVAYLDNLCFDDLQQDNEEAFNLGVYTCQKVHLIKSQFFSLTEDRILRNEKSCATVQLSKSRPRFLVMIPCKSNNSYNDKWDYAYGYLKHIKSNLCVERKGLKANDYLIMDICDSQSLTQKWRIEH